MRGESSIFAQGNSLKFSRQRPWSHRLL